jgi:hypothetical protein
MNQKNLIQIRKQKRKGKDCIFEMHNCLKLTTTQSATSQDVATT